jgi:uncharacterized membrane protein (UPF0127 family)
MLLLLFLLSAVISQPAEIQTVCFGETCFHAELAVSNESQLKGLMYRELLPDAHAMLFIYDKEIRPVMYMKNMKFSLDLIWLDRNRKIVSIAKNVPPCQSDPCPLYRPEGSAMYVLEVNAGVSDAIHLQRGDTARFMSSEEKSVQKL